MNTFASRASLLLAACLSAAAAGCGESGAPPFAAPVRYAVGELSLSMKAADLNGDGWPDIALSNSKSNDVGVLLNQGDGTLAAMVRYPVGVAPGSIDAADLDGDDSPDLLVANTGAQTLTRLFNQGDGVFGEGMEVYASGAIANPHSALAIDVNGDGQPNIVEDLWLAFGLGRIEVWSEWPAAQVTSDPYPLEENFQSTALAAADLDGDGAPDLLAGSISNAGDQFRLHTWLNDGTGLFPARVDLPLSWAPWSIVNGDLDGDGDTDVALAASDPDNQINWSGVLVLRNDGTGTLGTPVAFASEDLGTDSTECVAAFDLEGDGDLDLATGGTRVVILQNTGDGELAPMEPLPGAATVESSDKSSAVLAVDMDGDGRTDLVTTDGYELSVRINLSP